MKVLLVAKVPAYFEKFRKKNQPFPGFQAQTFWLKAIRKLGHQAKVFRYSDCVFIPTKLTVMLKVRWQKFSPDSFRRWQLIRNKFYQYFPGNYVRSLKLVSVVKKWNPDVLIIAGGVSKLTKLPLLVAKKTKCKIFLLHGEDPLISATKWEKDNLGFFDQIIVNDQIHKKHWEKLGANKVICLPYTAFNPDYYCRYRNRQFQYQLCFVGTLSLDRLKILKQLLIFKPAIFGYLPKSIQLDDNLKPFYCGEAWGKQVVKIYNQSKIILNFVPEHMPVGGNNRTFEIPGCGGFQLASRCPTQWFQPGKEIEIFSSISELKSKIKYYLEHDYQRQQIAQAGYLKAGKHHTYRHRFRKILAL